MSRRLFISNIKFEADEGDIRAFFVEGGYLPKSVKLCFDRSSGHPRGFGFVELDECDDALEVIAALDKQEFMGRRISVRAARPSESNGNRQGGARR